MRMLALVTVALASTTASAGTYIESSETELGSKEAPSVSKVWFDGGRMRSNDGSGAGAIFKNKTIYALDAEKKTYTTIDKAQMDRLGGQLASARKQMEAQLANMPPERREMMEKMMSQMGGGAAGAMAKPVKRDVTKTGRTETVSGFKCTVWEVAIDGVKEQELCAAAPSALPGGTEVLATMREIGAMMKGLTDSLGSLAQRSATDAWWEIEKINGVPILTRDFEEGKATSEMRLSVVRSESVPASMFEVPAGYKERKMPAMGAAE